MMNRRLRIKTLQSLTWAVLIIGPATFASAQPAGFTEEVVVPGLNLPVGLAFGPGGVMYIWEKGGTVRIARDGQVNGYLYLAYTVELNGVARSAER